MDTKTDNRADNKQYNQILKATSLFGGVQFVTIVIAIIRTKIVSILLGTIGLGINELLTSTTQLIISFTNFGLGTSAIKSVSSAQSSGDIEKVAKIIYILRRLVWITGFLGTFITIITAKYLSIFAFNNENYTLSIQLVSITVLLTQISVGQTVLLRGLRKLNELAQSTITGALGGLILSAPIYYIWGIKGIVPALILTSIITLIRTWYYSKNIILPKVTLSFIESKPIAKEMLKLGLVLSISSMFVMAKAYGLRAFVSNFSGLEMVGLFGAGLIIINKYVNLVFAAMSTDYYPRLVSLHIDKLSFNNLVNNQTEVALLILGPLIVIIQFFAPLLISILYSDEFISIELMIKIAMIGTLFKGSSWALGYIILAKGKSSQYLSNELLGGTLTFICQLAGFYYFQLEGYAIGYLIGYIVYYGLVLLVTAKLFNYKVSNKVIILIAYQVIFTILSFNISIKLKSNIYQYWIFGFILILISISFSLFQLTRKSDVLEKLKKKIRRNGK